MYRFKFADIGEGLHEGKVAEVYPKKGDKVSEGDSLFSVETDKVTSDIPSPVDGTVSEILIEVGQTIHVGEEVFVIDDGSGEDKAPAEAKAKSADPQAPPLEEEAASVVGEVKVSNELLNNDFTKPNSNAKPSQVLRAGFTTEVKNQDNVLTTPLARKLAADKNIDITSVTGTGFNNRVLVKDIENFVPKTRGSYANPVGTREDTKEKTSAVRQAIARAMRNSWSSVAYTNLVTEVNMSSLWTQRKTLTTKQAIEKLGVKVTFLPFVVKAVAIALDSFPNLNAKYDNKTQEITQFGAKNIGVAVDTPHGLFVPVIKNVEQKGLVTIAQEITQLAKKARDKKLTTQDMSGGTFSVTNYGSVGAMHGVPVINYPELSILGVGTIVDRVLPDSNGQFYAAKVMNITCAADHQWIDGADIGRFMHKVKQILENPILLLGELNV